MEIRARVNPVHTWGNMSTRNAHGIKFGLTWYSDTTNILQVKKKTQIVPANYSEKYTTRNITITSKFRLPKRGRFESCVWTTLK